VAIKLAWGNADGDTLLYKAAITYLCPSLWVYGARSSMVAFAATSGTLLCFNTPLKPLPL
jgi:hypothetical protein